MKTHLLLIGFSCTGKTSLGQKAFGEDAILDSDDELLKWIGNKKNLSFAHVYEIYMKLGRGPALSIIEEAEDALIDGWTNENSRKIISLGPGFPLRKHWPRLREMSYVVLFRKSPAHIYRHMKERRSNTFICCPEAKTYDNWDIGVIVDEHQREFSQEDAIDNIRKLLLEREQFYRNNDTDIDTDDQERAIQRLKELKTDFEKG